MATRLTEAELQARTDAKIAKVRLDAELRACADDLRALASEVRTMPVDEMGNALDVLKERIEAARAPATEAAKGGGK